jgi:16S rRNA (cytosine1402-N4)-methyltransferase
MMAEVLAALRPKAGGRYADGTLGGAGHAAAILAASSPTGWLFGCDRDGAAIEAARQRLGEFAGRFELRQGNFADLADWVEKDSCDGVLLDLGVSSPQLDQAERGFSFQHDGPLDMRMDRRQQLTAADLVNTTGADELARVLWDLGGEREARRFARAIAKEREERPFHSTLQLAQFIERLAPRRGRRAHPATRVFQALRMAVNDEVGSLRKGLAGAFRILKPGGRVFQALRMAVNDEVGSLRKGLAGAFRILKPGGRLAVITFQSLDDRIVKGFGRARALDYTFNGGMDVPELRKPRAPELTWVQRKALTPNAAELEANPRSRSAQLRVMQKTGAQ